MDGQNHELRHARTELESAVKSADDEEVRELARETAAAFAELTMTDQMADHAVFDGHLNALRQARKQATGDAETKIENALEHAESYREGLEQA